MGCQRSLCVLLVVLAAPLAAAATPSAEPPIAITVEAPQQLRLGPRGYTGKIKVSIVNRSDRPRVVHHGEENYLVFESADGKLDLICHSCACMQDSAPPQGDRGPFSVGLPPGAKKELLFFDWGCSGGGWGGPPPGRYRLTYRVFLERRRTPADPRSCCPALRAPEFWKGAIVSAPVAIAIVGRAPKKK